MADHPSTSTCVGAGKEVYKRKYLTTEEILAAVSNSDDGSCSDHVIKLSDNTCSTAEEEPICCEEGRTSQYGRLY